PRRTRKKREREAREQESSISWIFLSTWQALAQRFRFGTLKKKHCVNGGQIASGSPLGEFHETGSAVDVGRGTGLYFYAVRSCICVRAAALENGRSTRDGRPREYHGFLACRAFRGGIFR